MPACSADALPARQPTCKLATLSTCPSHAHMQTAMRGRGLPRPPSPLPRATGSHEAERTIRGATASGDKGGQRTFRGVSRGHCPGARGMPPRQLGRAGHPPWPGGRGSALRAGHAWPSEYHFRPDRRGRATPRSGCWRWSTRPRSLRRRPGGRPHTHGETLGVSLQDWPPQKLLPPWPSCEDHASCTLIMLAPTVAYPESSPAPFPLCGAPSGYCRLGPVAPAGCVHRVAACRSRGALASPLAGSGRAREEVQWVAAGGPCSAAGRPAGTEGEALRLPPGLLATPGSGPGLHMAPVPFLWSGGKWRGGARRGSGWAILALRAIPDRTSALGGRQLARPESSSGQSGQLRKPEPALRDRIASWPCAAR